MGREQGIAGCHIPAAVWHGCGHSAAEKWDSRRMYSEIKNTGLSCTGSIEDVGMVVLSVLAHPSLRPFLPGLELIQLSFPSIHKGTVWIAGF